MPLLADVSQNAVPILGLLLGIYIINKIHVFNRLREFKGPFWAGFSDWPHGRAMLSDRCNEWYAEVNEKYGPIARIAPNILMTSSPELFTRINIKSNYKRYDWFYNGARIEYQKDNVFSQTDNEKHDKRRKQMAPGYSGRENLDLEPAVDLLVQKLVNTIRSKYISSDARIVPMDLSAKIQYFTLDVISSIGFGKEFGMLDKDADEEGYIKSAEDGLVLCNTALALGFSWLTQAPLIGKFLLPSVGDKEGYGKMIAVVFRSVDERVSNPADKRSDMLASFMRNGLAGDELRSEALEQVIAGSDTTATGIRAIFLHIMSNPRVYSKLQREIDEAAREGRVPASGEGIVTMAQTKQLPYLQAVIREGLRLFPPVSGILAREVPPGGDTVTINGESVLLPGGTIIGPSTTAMQRDPALFGQDARAFRPERWLEADPETLLRMTHVNDLVFGYGRFQCLGKTVAQMELSKSVFELMRNFDLALQNPRNPWNSRNVVSIFVIKDLWVQVRDRTQ